MFLRLRMHMVLFTFLLCCGFSLRLWFYLCFSCAVWALVLCIYVMFLVLSLCFYVSCAATLFLCFLCYHFVFMFLVLPLCFYVSCATILFLCLLCYHFCSRFYKFLFVEWSLVVSCSITFKAGI